MPLHNHPSGLGCTQAVYFLYCRLNFFFLKFSFLPFCISIILLHFFLPSSRTISIMSLCEYHRWVIILKKIICRDISPFSSFASFCSLSSLLFFFSSVSLLIYFKNMLGFISQEASKIWTSENPEEYDKKGPVQNNSGNKNVRIVTTKDRRICN